MSNIIDFNKARERIDATKSHAVQFWSEDQLRTEIENIAGECANEYTIVLELNSQLLDSLTYIETLNIYLGGLLMAHGSKSGDYSAWMTYWEEKQKDLIQLELDFDFDDEE